MINLETVLILGAGASMPYRYPSGRNLMYEVLDATDKGKQNRINDLVALGIDSKIIDDFHRELRLSQQISVDAFLEHRPEFLDVGKLAIVLCLIHYEESSYLFDRKIREKGWYQYLFNKLNAPINMFHKNPLQIITFNYDRSLEHFLFTALKHSYGKDDKEIAAMLNRIPIIHVYGSLGPLPWQDRSGRAYEAKATPEEIKVASQNIDIVLENSAKSLAFNKAFVYLRDAQIIFILGFGYHETNMRRLRIIEIGNKSIIGTRYGFGKAEVKALHAKCPRITFAPEEWDILDTFKNFVSLE